MNAMTMKTLSDAVADAAREVASFVGTEGYYEAQTLAAKLDGRPEGTTLAFSFRVIGPYRIEKVKTRMTVEG